MPACARLLLGLLLVSMPAAAQLPDIPSRRFAVDHLVAIGGNPTIAEYNTRLGYKMRLGESQELLWHNTYLFTGAQVRINPAYSTIGPMVEWQPIALFRLRALADVYGIYGILGRLQSWASPLDEYTDALQNTRAAARENYATSGWHAMLQPTVQAKLGPVALVNSFSAEYWSIRLRDADTVWYETGLDILVPGQGWTFTNDTTLAYIAGSLTVAAQLRYTGPLYTQAHVRAGEDPGAVANHSTRTGLLAAYTFFDNGFTGFNRPTVFATAGWYLQNRYRTGVETPQSRPYFALGFSFAQDFAL